MSEIPRSADFLVDLALTTPGMLEQMAIKPEETLKTLAKTATKNLPPPAYVGDTMIYRVVVWSLGLVAILAVIGAIVLSMGFWGKEIQIPDILTALGSAAIGALAGLLAPSPTIVK